MKRLDWKVYIIFVLFLMSNRALLKFRRNYIERNLPTDRPPSDVIYLAFIWYNTPEGFDYWHKLDVKWLGVCKRFNLK